MSINSMESDLRSNIYFESVLIPISHGNVFADNGYGSVDRMEVYYEQELTAENIPDSLELNWPGRPGEDRRVASGTEIIFDPLEPNKLTAIFTTPFPEEITTFAENRLLGAHYASNPFDASDSKQVTFFSIIDSVGPLIKAASVKEKNTAGTDTLILTFTEPVLQESLVGQTLLLRKDFDDTEVPILVLDVILQSDNNDVVKVIVEDAGENSPQRGDFLRFHPNGGVVDGKDNAGVHPDNREVRLGLISVPPQIDSAAYFDVNTDGEVDRAIVYFDKSVNPNDFSMTFHWTSGNETGTISSDNFTLIDERSLHVDLRGAFSFDVKNQTSGAMMVTVSYVDHEQRVSSAVIDRAAPVITSAQYRHGVYNDHLSSSTDTLIVTFSEPVEYISHDMPFNLFTTRNESPEEYNFVLRFIRQIGEQHLFTVEGREPSSVLPSKEDSIYINPLAAVKDYSDNSQQNSNNKRVKLEIDDATEMWELKVAPIPYYQHTPVYYDNYGYKKAILFELSPIYRGFIVDNHYNEIRLDIYDHLGNVVFSGTMEHTKNSEAYRAFWNLKNRKGRTVATGTYLAVASFSDETNTRKKINNNHRKFSVLIK
ncbi:hypothetical protein QA601_11340 [Chitinispirillales bacterium ANBcel5]|uniref:hypothetical protein n=1 Tax=Cellulosispirillum alkaliphilum TaxID=3039283 RepID=UPI002A50DCB4|nr:hypothetical protein [Chitinispirillales bacterium ANBcel5]